MRNISIEENGHDLCNVGSIEAPSTIYGAKMKVLNKITIPNAMNNNLIQLFTSAFVSELST